MNNDNQNNDLGLPKKDYKGISNEYDSILEKQQRIKEKSNNNNNNNNTENTINKSVKKKSRTVSFAFDDEHFHILKNHFNSKGMITHSIGIRGILLDYMKNNGLIDK